MSCFITYAQEEAESAKASTFEKFLSKTGTFVRLTEYKLPDVVKGTWKSYAMTADLRKLSSENEDIWFLHIEKESYQRNNAVANIAQSDLEDLLRAVEVLQQVFANTNGLGNADYIEEKFTTKDDFRFGFYISRNKKGEEEAKWFINLNTNLSGASYAFDSPEQIKALFENAISAIANYSN
jgi:hypothetical protein